MLRYHSVIEPGKFGSVYYSLQMDELKALKMVETDRNL